MSFRFTTNINPSTNAEFMFQLKALLLLQGWTLQGNGDVANTNTFSNDTTPPPTASDGVTDLLTVAALMNFDRIWWRVRSPDNTREILFQRGLVPEDYRIKYSRSARFIGGTPAPNTAPSATDEVFILGGGTDASPTFAQLFGFTEGLTVGHMGADNTNGFGFYFVAYPSGTVPETAIFLDPMRPGSFPVADTDPVMVYATFDTNVLKVTGVLDGASAALGFLGPTAPGDFVNIPLSAIERGAIRLFPGNMPVNPHNGLHETGPVLWGKEDAGTPRGWKGVSGMLRLRGGNSAAPLPNTSTLGLPGAPGTFPSAQGDHIVFDDVVFPWDSITIPLGRETGAVDVAANDLSLRQFIQPTIRALTPLAGQDLAATRQEARFTPIEFEMTLDSDAAGPLILAKIGAVSYFPLLVFDGTIFSPNFQQHSTIVSFGRRRRFSILPTGGWRDQVTLTIGEFREAINQLGTTFTVNADGTSVFSGEGE